MISQQALGEAILSLLCFHPDLAIKIAPRITDANLFSQNRTNQRIARTALDYINKYASPPGITLEYLLENDLQRGEEGRLLGQQIQFLSKRVLEIDANFVLGELDRFLEVQNLQNNFQQALEYLDQGELEQARQAAFKFDSKKEESSTLDFTDPKSLHVLDKIQDGDYFSTGIQVFDKLGIRLGRKMFGFLIASKGKGKSWSLIEMGKGGLQHHHRVLHITLEMSQEKTYLRYLQSVFALTKKEVESVKIPIFNRDETGKFVSIDFSELHRDSVFQRREDILKKLVAMKRSRLLIKEFPTGTLTMDNLYLYMQQLKREQGFKADLLLIDYLDLMKINREQLRIDTGRLYVDARGLAVSEDLALGSATQGNRESEDAKLVRNTNVAEDWSKIATGDLVMTLTKTPQEERMNYARVYVNNFRDEEDKKLALISQSYATGQFAIDSVLMSHEVATSYLPASDT